MSNIVLGDPAFTQQNLLALQNINTQLGGAPRRATWPPATCRRFSD